jgi:hypothetical protein
MTYLTQTNEPVNVFDPAYDLYAEYAEIRYPNIVTYELYRENSAQLDRILDHINFVFPYAYVARELIEMNYSKIHIECTDEDLDKILYMIEHMDEY